MGFPLNLPVHDFGFASLIAISATKKYPQNCLKVLRVYALHFPKETQGLLMIASR